MTANHTFLIVPETAIPDPDKASEGTSAFMMVDALLRFLSAHKLTAATDRMKPANLLIIVPRRSDQMTIEDVFFLRSAAECELTLVLDIAKRLPALPSELLPWLNVIDSPSFNVKHIAAWLDKEKWGAPLKWTKHNIDNIKEQIGRRAGTASNALINNGIRFTNRLDEDFVTKIIGHETTPKLLKSPLLADFYYGLIRLGGKYAAIEHDLNHADNDLAKSQERHDSLAEIGRLRIVRRFVDVCQDTLMALRFPLPDRLATNERDTILLIDDNPASIQNDLERIINDYQLGLTLKVCNPCESLGTGVTAKKPVRLQDITEYSSLSRIDFDRLICRDLPLKEVSLRCACILVDVLFDSVDGKEEEAGMRVIEGLTRMLQDARSQVDGNVEDMPPILALSRADDLTKVQACLRAGAAGYVLKSRLTSLPAILGRLAHSSFERPDAWHKNFRSLYRLPSETVSLLKTITIPRKDFSRADNDDLKIQERDQVIAQLLTAVPKPDLHVHAGSLMRPEFLVVASLVMLLRHKEFDQRKGEMTPNIKRAARLLREFWMGETDKGLLWLNPDFSVVDREPFLLTYTHNAFGIQQLAGKVRKWLKAQLEVSTDTASQEQKPRCRDLRAALHHVLGIRDHWPLERALKKLDGIPDTLLFTFALAYSGTLENKETFHPLFCADNTERQDDVLRFFILHLALECYKLSGKVAGLEVIDVLAALFSRSEIGKADERWSEYRKHFYYEDRWKSGMENVKVSVALESKNLDTHSARDLLLSPCPSFAEYPIEYLLASGTRCDRLKDYLEGCELAGAEFLKHPFLIRLYAQQVVHDMVSNGILYAEIRAAISGYECQAIEFTFQEACNTFIKAFSLAQKLVLNKCFRSSGSEKDDQWQWESPMLKLDTLLESPFLNLKYFPAKVGVILTGKRHKPTREMLREAAGAVVMQARDTGQFKSAQEFVKEFEHSALVGFDLAGQEDDYPPERFRAEFEQLARLHIPITAHAGENAHAGYIDSAVLDLRARRLGHGLALSEDKGLMRRVREDRVCVELCPVSNFQTSRFVPAGRGRGVKREYPLREFMNNGNAVCLNTDNPVISYTNIIKEYFQASFAYGVPGLSLWAALRLMRMGFVHAFMSLPERRAIMELADQLLYDLFSDAAVTATLRRLNEMQVMDNIGAVRNE